MPPAMTYHDALVGICRVLSQYFTKINVTEDRSDPCAIWGPGEKASGHGVLREQAMA